VRQKGTSLIQGRNRFLNKYENYCLINYLLELNSPGLTVGGVDRIVGRFGWRSHLTAGLLLAGGAVAGSALAAVVHRAALGLALTAFAWVGLWWFRQRPS
jgi:hypothetical protein